MACKVRYLNSSGIHMREIPGISKLADALPSQWLLYASLQCYPPRSHPIEIDAMIVMDDRVLLLELKDFHGHLTCNGDQWVLNGRPRGRSAVDMIAEKARKIKGIVAGSIPHFSKYPVDSRVVLTGSATKDALSASEKGSVWSLDEACSLGNPAKRTALIPSTLLLKKAYHFASDFDRLTRNARQWSAAEAIWDGYKVTEEDVVVHPQKIWREHRAERAKDPRVKGLLRIWAFDKLPPGLNSADHRTRIAEREMRAIGYLNQVGSPLARNGGILLPTGEDKDEILTQHFELRMLPRDYLTLDRYLISGAAELASEDRIVMASALLSVAAELHTAGIAHRDLGPRSIWVGSPAKLALSGLMACQIPDEESLSDWFAVLRGHSVEMPEDFPGAEVGTGKQRDVYSIGRLICQILGAQSPAGRSNAPEIASLPDEFSALRACLERSLALKPSQRFSDAEAFSDDFAATVEQAAPDKIDQTLLDRVETTAIPYLKYPQVRMLEQSARVNLYVHRTESEEEVAVKIWPGIRRGTAATDIAMTRLFEGVRRLRVSPVSGLPETVDFGLSGVGPFIVYRYRKGETLDKVGALDGDKAADVAIALVNAVDAIHAMDLFHGDMADKNVLLEDEHGKVLVLDLFDLGAVGDGRIRTPDFCPPGWERLNEQQIDRFGTLKVCRKLLESAGDDRLKPVLALLDDELRRDAIETFEPALIELKAAAASFRQPPLPRFDVKSERFGSFGLSSDNGTFYARRQIMDHGATRYTLSGVDRALHIEVRPNGEARHWVSDVSYASLARDTARSTPVQIALDLSYGAESGLSELLEYLKNATTDTAAPTEGEERAAPRKPRIDVRRLWRDSIDLEGTFYPEVEILEERGTRGGLAVFGYERLSRDFDFDGRSAVEVRFMNRKIGELDLSQTDERSLVVRYCDRHLAPGDRLTLVDRRAKASLDRRRKAVDRILANAAALPALFGYFACDDAPDQIDYGTLITDAQLDSYELNEGQRNAFRNILRYGPVGLLQGPPGTGKTYFIAALVHWLVTEAGAQKILIASQSHEAVNNAIEKLVDLMKRQRRRPSLLRIGSKGITQKISPFHTETARERYRVRFESAFRHRVIALATASGLSRDFAADAVEIERLMGRPARRIKALLEIEQTDLSPEDRRRYGSSMRSAANAFRSAARDLVAMEADISRMEDELDAAYDSLLDRYPQMSPADVAKIRGIISLSLEWLDALSTSHRNFDEFLVKTRTVISATCVGAGQNRIKIDAKAYDWVIVDEAARCTPGELAVPIQIGRRLLLVGDHLQLRPMVDDRVIKELRGTFPGSSRLEIARSDFERVFESPFGNESGQVLTEQYRMDDAICRLVSETFYEPHRVRLKTSKDREANLAFQSALLKPIRRPITWIDTSKAPAHMEKTAEWNRHTFWNQAEVAATIGILENISRQEALVSSMASGKSESPIGVICMYSAQKVMIEQAFARTSWESRFRRLVRIDTVDSYQGKENDVVLVSLVRCNANHDTGHVGTDNRVNVAFSRAKERLIVIGARSMWKALLKEHPVRRVSEFFDANPKLVDVMASGEL
jgi:serine/threonine protein kinase